MFVNVSIAKAIYYQTNFTFKYILIIFHRTNKAQKHYQASKFLALAKNFVNIFFFQSCSHHHLRKIVHLPNFTKFLKFTLKTRRHTCTRKCSHRNIYVRYVAHILGEIKIITGQLIQFSSIKYYRCTHTKT